MARSDRAGLSMAARRAATVAVVAAALLMLALPSPDSGGGDRSPAVTGALTVSAADARSAADDFTQLLNEGRVDAAIAMTGGSLEGRPEAIDGFAVNPLLDVDQEYRYLEWTAALGGRRAISSCTASRWRHLVRGTPVVEDAQLLRCAGTFTNGFYAAGGLGPAPTEVVLAVGPGSQILMYKERVVGTDHTETLLRFRRWLRVHHPGLVGVVFTPGGTPVTTPASAQLMLALAAAFATPYSSMAVSGQP